MLIHVANKTITIDDDFVKHYETMLGGKLQNMAKHYLFCYASEEDVVKSASNMTEKEVKEAILAIANEELEMNGVPYNTKS